MDASYLTGVWRLVSGEFRSSDNIVTFPWGKNPEGQIIYTENGYVAAQIMAPNRPRFVSRDHMKGTEIEVRAAFEGYQAYYGAYMVDEKTNVINHRIDGSVFPNLVGHTLRRYYEFSEKYLTLRTPPMRMGGVEVTGAFVWTRPY